MVARRPDAPPTEPHHPRCDTADQCHQNHCDINASREILDAAWRTIERRDQLLNRIRTVLEVRGRGSVDTALAMLDDFEAHR